MDLQIRGMTFLEIVVVSRSDVLFYLDAVRKPYKESPGPNGGKRDCKHDVARTAGVSNLRRRADFLPGHEHDVFICCDLVSDNWFLTNILVDSEEKLQVESREQDLQKKQNRVQLILRPTRGAPSLWSSKSVHRLA